MSFQNIQPYLFLGLVAAFIVWRRLKFRRVRGSLPQAKERGALVIDVRSPGEYRAGSSEGSINIPLGDLERRISELDPAKPIVLCCASGARSGVAVGILKRHGFKDVVNAGPWTNTRGL